MSEPRRERGPRQKPGAPMGSAERSARISAGLLRYNAQRRARGAVVDADLRALTRGEAECRPSLRPYIAAGVAEAQAIVEALGGPEALSPQRQALMRDVARLSAVVGAVTAAFFRSEDPELIPKLTSAIAARRGLLERLGLDERRVEHDLGTYIRQRASAQNGAGSTIHGAPDPTPAENAESVADANAAALSREPEGPPDAA